MNPRMEKKVPRRGSKVLSLLLGFIMLMFGVRKFFEPIRSRFDIQIQQSHLPHGAILVGKVTETLVGILFILPWFSKSLSAKSIYAFRAERRHMPL